MLVETMQFEQ